MTDRFQNVARRVQNVARRAGLRTAGLLLLAPSAIITTALAQALPAAEVTPISTGFALPRAAGSLQYAVSAAESLTWGYYGNSGPASGTLLTGDLAYLSGAKKDTFSLVFSGGHSWTTSSEPAYTFMNLALSQVIDAGRWSFVVADSVNYLPETPATGLSGIPGAGDLGVAPVQIGVDTGQGVLTDYSTRVDNSSTAGLSRGITAKTSISASGTYTMLRFVNDPMGVGLDSDQEEDGRDHECGAHCFSRIRCHAATCFPCVTTNVRVPHPADWGGQRVLRGYSSRMLRSTEGSTLPPLMMATVCCAGGSCSW